MCDNLFKHIQRGGFTMSKRIWYEELYTIIQDRNLQKCMALHASGFLEFNYWVKFFFFSYNKYIDQRECYAHLEWK